MSYRVLFVCTGNICRSPTAEAFLRHRVQEAGLSENIECDSCGTHSYHIGENPDPRTIAAAFKKRIDMGDLVARKIHPKDFDKYDLILAMDRDHLAALQKQSPKTPKAKLALYLDYVGMGANKDVPDPYYKDGAVFNHVVELVHEATDKLIERIRKEIAA